MRRENYQLRKEIWSLRDEYDRLDKLLRSKNCNASLDHIDDDDEIDGEDDIKCDSCQSDEVSSHMNAEQLSINRRIYVIETLLSLQSAGQ